jgi:Restriction endonuclease
LDVLKDWLEGRRRAGTARVAEKLAANIAQKQAAEKIIRLVVETQMSELETKRQSISRLVEEYTRKLPPLGSSVEAAVDSLLIASQLDPGLADLHRPTFVALAIKFGRPDERLVGVYVMTRFSSNNRKSYPVIAVGFTQGFGVKCGARTFRTDIASANPRSDVSMEFMSDDHSLFLVHAGVRLGEEMCAEVYKFTGSLNSLYLMIEAQAKLAEEPQTETVLGQLVRPRPARVLIRTWRDAELVAAEWMRYWGYTNVAATAVGTDGGIDVVSNEAVAQVKAETSATGRPKVQQHHGVAVSEGKAAIFFALAGFTPGARAYAEENGILLFKFDLQGEPEPVNAAAHALMAKWS